MRRHMSLLIIILASIIFLAGCGGNRIEELKYEL